MVIWADLSVSLSGQLVREGKSRVGSIDGVWVRVIPSGGGSVFSDHLVLAWVEGGRTFGIGFHGWGRDSRTLTLEIAEALKWVAPR